MGGKGRVISARFTSLSLRSNVFDGTVSGNK